MAILLTVITSYFDVLTLLSFLVAQVGFVCTRTPGADTVCLAGVSGMVQGLAVCAPGGGCTQFLGRNGTPRADDGRRSGGVLVRDE